MVKKAIIVLAGFLLAALITASNDGNITANKDGIITNSDYGVISIYLDVLQSKADFIEALNADMPSPQNFQGGPIKLKDYLLKIGEGATWGAKEFTVIDVNGDGINDIILSLTHPYIMGNIMLVLVYEDAKVYSNIFMSRHMSQIKKDGTFYDSVPGHFNVMKLLFSSGVFSSKEVLHSPDYYEVSSDDFSSAMKEQDIKEDAKWFPFSMETITADLFTAWHSND